MYNFYKKKNDNYIYEYTRHYINNENVSIEQRIVGI